jgi:hypothetical protein
MTITLQALSLVEKVEPVQVRFTLCLRDQRSMWMQDGYKVYMDSYTTSIGPCFMVTWITFTNHLLEEVGLTQNGRPWHSRCSQLLIYDISSCVRTCMNRKFIEITFCWGSGHIWLHTTLEGPWFRKVCLGRPLDTFFWALTISWSRLLARVWSGPKGHFKVHTQSQMPWRWNCASPKESVQRPSQYTSNIV